VLLFLPLIIRPEHSESRIVWIVDRSSTAIPAVLYSNKHEILSNAEDRCRFIVSGLGSIHAVRCTRLRGGSHALLSCSTPYQSHALVAANRRRT
jgi:hypothetical protein